MKYSTRKILSGFLLIAVILIVAFLISQSGLFGNESWVAGSILLLAGIYYLRRTLDKRVQGDLGEADIDDELTKLPFGYFVNGSTIIKNHGNIDNVIVGPTGVWSLEIKSHKRFIDFLIAGPIKQSLAEALAVREVLESTLGRKFFVQPVVVYSDPRARVRFGMKKQRGVYVIGIQWLTKLLTEREIGYQLDTNTVMEISQVLQKYRE